MQPSPLAVSESATIAAARLIGLDVPLERRAGFVAFSAVLREALDMLASLDYGERFPADAFDPQWHPTDGVEDDLRCKR